MPSLKQNLDTWARHYRWEKDGDEWSDQAVYNRIPYAEWKESIIRNLINANIKKSDVVLEIAPGHGRWSMHIAAKAHHAILVDMSLPCIEHCRRRLAIFSNVSYIVNDGKTFRGVKASSIDFVFSYDSFVHMEPDVILAYLHEIRRVLKKGGKAIIHHPGRNHSTLWLWRFFEPLGSLGRILYMVPSMGRISHHDGWRSNVSRELFAGLSEKSRLKVVSQSDSWEAGKNCRLFSDCVTYLKKD